MVGGVIIGISHRDEKFHVNVADCPHYPRHGRGDECPRPDTCCVYTDGRRLDNGTIAPMAVGDLFWWQCGICYWTPRKNLKRVESSAGKHYDIQLRKIGYSH